MSTPSTSTATGSSSAELSSFRGGCRLALLAGWSFGVISAWGLLTLLLLPARGARHRVRRGTFRAWGRGVCRILGVRIAEAGVPPRSPFLLVSNHLGYLDIAVYAARVPVRFVAKSEVRSWPVIGLLARAMGTIFIDRAARRDMIRVLDDLGGAVADGDGVVVFAEATSSAGQVVLPFRPGLLEWAARSGYPVHYAAIGYRTPAGAPPAHLAVCWWGEMTFADHLARLARVPRIDTTVRYGSAPIAERDRKRLADRLHRAVSEGFIPVVTE